MGKYIISTLILIVGGIFIWTNLIGITKKEIKSSDGKFVIRISEVYGGTLVRLSTKHGWPLFKKLYSRAEMDGVPFAFEWFPDAVAMIDHFDFGTSIMVLALPSGQRLQFMSQRESEVREGLRWKYAFTDYPKMIREKKDTATGGMLRVYTNEPNEGSLKKNPVWFSNFAVLFKFEDPIAREESILASIALKELGKFCSNPDLYRSVKASFENHFFHAIRFSCHSPRDNKQ